MRRLDLVRDVLDKQLVDRHHVEMGRVDGIAAELPEDGPPRIVALESGGLTLVRRLHAGLARRLERRRGRALRPLRVPCGRVRDVDGIDVEVDADARRTRAFALERRVRAWLARIPGGS